LAAIEQRLDALDASQSQLKEAYARSRARQTIVAASADVDIRAALASSA
jgi:hypothetical protein